MRSAGLESVFLQFADPARAYGALRGKDQGRALAAAGAVIVLIGFIPLMLQGDIPGSGVMVPFLIVLERIMVSSAAGLAVYAVSFATGERKPLWAAVTSCFLAMGAFMIMVALIALISHVLSLPPDLTWSPAELLMGLPLSRLSVFLLVFASRLDLASLVTVYLWGRGLSTVWNIDRAAGQRMVWAVYLFGILLLALPVFTAAPGTEGAL